MDHISVQPAADKADIRKWLRIGVERGKTAMIVVHDEMGYPDNCDSPYYCDDAEDVYNLLRDFDHDPMSKVMEIYDLTADIEAQLDEHRALHLPDLPETESEEEAPPRRYPALGLLASGETRLAFMERKNAELINGKFLEDFGELGAVASPLHVFTDESQEFVYNTCVYILEQTELTKAICASLYRFEPDGTVSVYSNSLLGADSENKDSAHIPLPQHNSVEILWPYITFELSCAHGRDEYGSAYMHSYTERTDIILDNYDGFGMYTFSGSFFLDKKSHKLYEQAVEMLRSQHEWPAEAMALLHKAANEGHGDAMRRLVDYYTRIKPDVKTAASWSKRVAMMEDLEVVRGVRKRDEDEI